MAPNRHPSGPSALILPQKEAHRHAHSHTSSPHRPPKTDAPAQSPPARLGPSPPPPPPAPPCTAEHGGFLSRLLPRSIDTGDLLMLLILLLLVVDGEEEDQLSVILTAAAFLLS